MSRRLWLSKKWNYLSPMIGLESTDKKVSSWRSWWLLRCCSGAFWYGMKKESLLKTYSDCKITCRLHLICRLLRRWVFSFDLKYFWSSKFNPAVFKNETRITKYISHSDFHTKHTCTVLVVNFSNKSFKQVSLTTDKTDFIDSRGCRWGPNIRITTMDMTWYRGLIVTTCS